VTPTRFTTGWCSCRRRARRPSEAARRAAVERGAGRAWRSGFSPRSARGPARLSRRRRRGPLARRRLGAVRRTSPDDRRGGASADATIPHALVERLVEEQDPERMLESDRGHRRGDGGRQRAGLERYLLEPERNGADGDQCIEVPVPEEGDHTVVEAVDGRLGPRRSEAEEMPDAEPRSPARCAESRVRASANRTAAMLTPRRRPASAAARPAVPCPVFDTVRSASLGDDAPTISIRAIRRPVRSGRSGARRRSSRPAGAGR
jgi:hypothetical protein